MGMDMIELHMAIEDRFELSLGNSPHTQTVGELEDYIIRSLEMSGGMVGSKPSGECPCPRLFCELRRSLMERFNIPRNVIRPKMGLEELLPVESRKADWRSLQTSIGLQPTFQHPLELPLAVQRASYAVIFFVLSYPLWSIGFDASSVCGFAILMPLLLLLSVMLGGFAPAVLFPLTTRMPAGIGSVGEVVHLMAAHRREPLPAKRKTPGSWTPEAVREAVRTILSETFSIPPDEIHADSHFINDLLLD